MEFNVRTSPEIARISYSGDAALILHHLYAHPAGAAPVGLSLSLSDSLSPVKLHVLYKSSTLNM